MWHKQIKSLSSNREISILGCQIWSGFVFWWERWEQPEAFFWNIGWYMVSTMFLISSPNIREGPAQMFGWVETPKPSPRPQGWGCSTNYASMQHDLNISKGSCPGLRQESYTRGFAKGFCHGCHGFYCPKTCPKLRQGVTPHFLMGLTQISKSSVNLTMPTSRYTQSRARALFN